MSIPELGYADVRQAVQWLIRSFGFTERLRMGDHRAQLSYGAGNIVVTHSAVEPGTTGPAHSVMVRVSDVDAHFSRAKASGATIIRPPTSFPYGERQYTVADIGGHVWSFSQSVADVDPRSWGGELIEHAT